MIGLRPQLENLLVEDAPYGDLTTEALGLGGALGEMTFSARDEMILALVEDAAAIIEIAGSQVERFASSGNALRSGAPILTARGPAAGLFRSWKVAQTLIEIWSGVATGARAIVDAARTASPNITVACTRKNTPATKRFAVAAIRAGAATMHRLSLSETVLVFPEHLAFLDEPLNASLARLRLAAPEKKLIIEVTTIESAIDAAEMGFDVIQVEKFVPAVVAALVERLSIARRRPVIAVAGGVTVENAAAYAAAGADVLVTSSPYMASPRDVQVRISKKQEAAV